MTTEEKQLALREKPDHRPIMYQSWRHLSFLHWEVDSAEIQKLLPDGLKVETYEGKAYIGLVPFTMIGIRLAWLPEIPGTNRFHETNVRTYVTDENGTPGVWFFSLEAANSFAVRVARKWFGLPYHFAKMSLDDDGHGFSYESERSWPPPAPASCTVQTSDYGDVFEAAPGTLEFWLIERYLLFTVRGGRLMSGQVWHKPYRVRTAMCHECDESLIASSGVTTCGPPVLAHYSDGVDVSIFGTSSVTNKNDSN